MRYKKSKSRPFVKTRCESSHETAYSRGEGWNIGLQIISGSGLFHVSIKKRTSEHSCYVYVCTKISSSTQQCSRAKRETETNRALSIAEKYSPNVVPPPPTSYDQKITRYSNCNRYLESSVMWFSNLRARKKITSDATSRLRLNVSFKLFITIKSFYDIFSSKRKRDNVDCSRASRLSRPAADHSVTNSQRYWNKCEINVWLQPWPTWRSRYLQEA